jgi:hypothetical protein
MAKDYASNVFINCPFDEEYLPAICEELKLDTDEVTYNDYCNFVSDWLQEQS